MASTSGERGGGGKRTSVRTLVWTLVAACVLGLPTLAGASPEQRTRAPIAGPSTGRATPQSMPQSLLSKAAILAPAASTRFVDPQGDVQPGGMDVAGVTVSVEAGRLTFAIEIPSHATLPPAKYLGIGFDRDRNPATGNAGGIEYRVWVDGSRNTIQFDAWTSVGWATLLLPGLTLSFENNRALIGTSATTLGGTSFDFLVATFQQDGGTLDDAAPDQGWWTYAMCAGLSATIVGTDGPDQLTGTPGSDVIAGLGGNDTVDGGDGTDATCGDAGSDSVSGGAGNDQVDGGSEPDQVLGGDGMDAMFGGDGDDQMNGGPGDYDGIVGEAGNDSLEGGEGVDVAAFFDAPGGVQVSLASGVATGVGTDRLSGLEAIAGSPYGDTLEGDDGGNFFFPDVVILVPAGSDDVVRGGGGFDVVAFQNPVRANLATGRSTGEGTDRLSAIEGLYAQTASTLTGDAGANFLGGSDERDVLIGGGGDDSFVGRGGNDQIAGGPGADLVDGGAGNDAMDGGAGRGDILSYLSAPRRVTVRMATRRAQGDGADRLAAFEAVVGSGFGDLLEGSSSADRLQGKDGADTIRGAGGDDFLDGGGGRDRLEGGPAADYCFDGERNTGCEASDRSTIGGQSFRRPPQAPASRPFAWLDALVAFVRDGSAPVIPAHDSGPLSNSATLANADRYIYDTDVPGCLAKSGRFLASIRPPRVINRSDRPGALSVEWQATLKTKNGRVLARTALAEATIDITNAGGVVHETEWLVRRQPYRARPQSVPGTEPLRWHVELTLEGVDLPHEAPPPCPIAPRR